MKSPNNETQASGRSSQQRIVLPSDEPFMHVQVFHSDGNPPFICGARGAITQDIIAEIEQDLTDNLDDILGQGYGDYLFYVTREEGQQTFPETGQWDFPPHWELELLFFQQNA